MSNLRKAGTAEAIIECQCPLTKYGWPISSLLSKPEICQLKLTNF